jgi:hypothetical protein
MKKQIKLKASGVEHDVLKASLDFTLCFKRLKGKSQAGPHEHPSLP